MKATALISLVIAMFIVSITANAALSIKDKTLLLYLPCDEIKGGLVSDLSPNANNGTVVGTVNLVDGKISKALEFKEAGEVKCAYIALNNKSFTICMWVKPKLAGGAEQCVFSQMDANATNTSMHYRIYTNGTVRMGFYGNDLDLVGGAKADEWMHIAYYLDVPGKARRIYVNGAQAAQDAGLVGIEYLGKKGDTMIGSWGTTGQKFNGVIDEVQIWDRALSAAEIKDSMGDLKKSASVNPAVALTTTWGNIKY
ncbi:MAG: LamG domain-containing protein [Candidatus Poribacteria bacterium]